MVNNNTLVNMTLLKKQPTRMTLLQENCTANLRGLISPRTKEDTMNSNGKHYTKNMTPEEYRQLLKMRHEQQQRMAEICRRRNIILGREEK